MKDSVDLDAVIAAAKHHRVLMENDEVRVLSTRVEPGETVPMHTHQWPAVTYFLSISDLVRRDADGNVTMDSRKADFTREVGQAVWTPPLGPHTLENVGTRVADVVTVEIKKAGR